MRAVTRGKDRMQSQIAVGIPTIGRAVILRETLDRDLTRQNRRRGTVYRVWRETCRCRGSGRSLSGRACTAVRTGVATPAQRRDRSGGERRHRRVLRRRLPAGPRLISPPSSSTWRAIRTSSSPPELCWPTALPGPGWRPLCGRAILARPAAAAGGRSPESRPTFSGYGCNMAVRLAPMREHGLRFDERLPLYGWQEDVDLSRRLAAFGPGD